MNLETNFQMLDKVNKNADYEFNLFPIFNVKKRDRVGVEISIMKLPRPKGSYNLYTIDRKLWADLYLANVKRISEPNRVKPPESEHPGDQQ